MSYRESSSTRYHHDYYRADTPDHRGGEGVEDFLLSVPVPRLPAIQLPTAEEEEAGVVCHDESESEEGKPVDHRTLSTQRMSRTICENWLGISDQLISGSWEVKARCFSTATAPRLTATTQSNQ